MSESLFRKRVILALILLLFLSLTALLIGYFIRWPIFLFPKAAVFDISGKWELTVNITTPYVEEGKLLASLSQDPSGQVTGTVSDLNGENTKEISGQVLGEEFKSNQTRVVIKTVPSTGGEPVTYEADVIFEGEISEGGSRVSGKVTGEVITPKKGPLSGTFFAIRTATPSPSPTPTTKLTPTLPPLPTATPTQKPTPLPQPTATPQPQPPSPTPTPSSLPQRRKTPTDTRLDVNADGVVDFFDYNLIVAFYGKTGVNLACDINQDGICNALDISLVLIYFGKSF